LFRSGAIILAIMGSVGRQVSGEIKANRAVIGPVDKGGFREFAAIANLMGTYSESGPPASVSNTFCFCAAAVKLEPFDVFDLTAKAGMKASRL